MVKLAICHEGHTGKSLDSEIIKLLLKDLDLDINRVEFYGFGSKSNFFKKDYKVYKNLHLAITEQEIKKILFVLDADNEENDKALLRQLYKLAYPNTPYNFKHKNFDELKEKLQNLF